MNSNKSNIEDQLLIRFFQGDVSPEEKNEVANWIELDPANQQYADELKSVWEDSSSVRVFDQINVDKNWKEVQAKLKLGENQTSRQVFMLPRLIRYAAAIVLIAAVSYLVLRPTQPIAEMMTLTASTDGTSVELPDGTEVWLNKGSQIEYPSIFAKSERRIALKGEAFFEVEHNPKQPFIVKTGQTETRVLGTSFNLIESNDKEQTELVLVTGKVQFSLGEDQVILAPGDRVVVNEQGELVKETNPDLNFMAWKTQTLTFENTKMEQVIEDIAKLYNVEITIKEKSFKACPLTTRFENESLENVLETIEMLFSVEIFKQGNRYTISGVGC